MQTLELNEKEKIAQLTAGVKTTPLRNIILSFNKVDDFLQHVRRDLFVQEDITYCFPPNKTKPFRSLPKKITKKTEQILFAITEKNLDIHRETVNKKRFILYVL